MNKFNEAMKAITDVNEKSNNIRCYGIRGDDIDITIGQKLDASFDWDYEYDRPSTNKLNGTCAVNIGYLWFDGEDDDINLVKAAYDYLVSEYGYKNISVIAGTDFEYGADEKEVIIKNAEVIYIF